MLDFITQVGVPTAILFWVLFITNQTQRDILKQLRANDKTLANLTMVIHDNTTYLKARG